MIARCDARVEAVVEADLDAPAGMRSAAADRVDLRRTESPAGFSTSTCAPGSSARSARRPEMVVASTATTTTSGCSASSSSSVAQPSPPYSADERCAASGATSKAPTTTPVVAERLRALAADQPAADDRDAQRRIMRTRCPSALELEVERQLGRSRRRHRLAGVLGVLRVDEQEAAAARADQLAAERAGAPRERVEVVDALVGHARRALALVLPVLVHQLGVALEVAGLQQLAALEPDLLGAVEVLDHLAVVGLGALRPGRPGSSTPRAPRPCRRAGGCCAACAASSSRGRAARRRPCRPG